MLRKLLKYNLRAVFRPLCIFYFIALICAIIGRCFSSNDNNLLFKIIHEFFAGAALGLCFGIIINNATRIWEYTKRDFYGDQSYLTHTLPIPHTILYLVKFCTIIITTLTSLLVIAFILVINYLSPDAIEYIHHLIDNCGSIAEFIKFVLLILGVLIFEIVFIIQVGVTGIILGHRANNHRVAFSFIYAFSIFILANCLTFAVFNLWGIFDPEVEHMIHNGFSTNSVMVKLLGGAILAYTVYITITYYIGLHSFRHGIDVE